MLLKISFYAIYTHTMVVNCSSSVSLNFDLEMKNKIHYYSWKEHLKNNEIVGLAHEVL